MFTHPRFWLVVQMAACVLVLWASGLIALREDHDTRSYVDASRAPFREMLTSPRTIGYPLLLKAVSPWSPDFQAIPWLQLAAHFLAVAFLDLTLRRFGATPWQAFAVASGFLYTMLNDMGVSYLLTDSLAKSMAACTVGLLLWTSASPRNVGLWIGLAISLTATYQFRPAYLFLIPLAPVLGIVLLRLQSSWRGTPFRWRMVGSALCAVTLIPFVGFCLLRWMLVGHFGLVSFGGCAVVGVAGVWIDQPMIDNELPETLRPLAQEIFDGRRKMQLKSPYQRTGLDMYVWEQNHLAIVTQIAYPAALRLYGEDHMMADRQLSDLSKKIIKIRKAAYLRFLIYNLRDGLGKFLQTGFVLQAMLGLGLCLFALRVLLRPCGAIEVPTAAPLPPYGVMHAMLLVATLFAAAKLLLVALVESMIGRYLYAAGLFLPCACGLWIYQEVVMLRSRGPSSARADSNESLPNSAGARAG